MRLPLLFIQCFRPMKLAKAYQTNMVLVLGFMLIGLYLGIVQIQYIALAVLLLSAISEGLAKWIAKAWMFLGEQMGKVTSFVLLGLIFFVLLTPLAILKRLLGAIRSDLSKSTWQEVNYSNSKESFLKPW